jgi:hypothetical protein
LSQIKKVHQCLRLLEYQSPTQSLVHISLNVVQPSGDLCNQIGLSGSLSHFPSLSLQSSHSLFLPLFFARLVQMRRKTMNRTNLGSHFQKKFKVRFLLIRAAVTSAKPTKKRLGKKSKSIQSTFPDFIL